MARALSTAREDRILDLRRQGLTQTQIAERVGLTQQRIAQVLQARGDTFVPRASPKPSKDILPSTCEHCGGRLRYTTEPVTGRVVGICVGSGFHPGCGRTAA